MPNLKLVVEAKSPSDVKDAVETRLRVHIFKQRLHIEPFFVDFDPLNLGVITPARFERAVARIGVALSAAEIQVLINAYLTEKNKEKLVKWKVFAEGLNEVFAPPITAKQPDLRGEDGVEFVREFDRLATSVVQSAHRVRPADESALQQTLAALRQDVIRRRMLVKPYFTDQDKLHRGRISRVQFRRTLSVLGWDLSDYILDLLCWRYVVAEEPENVNWRKFLSDIDGYTSADEQPRSPVHQQQQQQPASPSKAKTVSAPDASAVLRKLQSEGLRRRIMLADAFEDYDKLRKGFIEPSRFVAVLRTTGKFELEAEEAAALINAYRSPQDATKIDYIKFAKEFESIYVPLGIQEHPDAVKTVTKVVPAVESKRDIIEGKSADKIDEVMNKLRVVVQKKGINHKPFFTGFDYAHSGTIHKSRFFSVLHTLGLEVTESDVELLAKRFGEGSDQRIKYPSFCAALDRVQAA